MANFSNSTIVYGNGIVTITSALGAVTVYPLLPYQPDNSLKVSVRPKVVNVPFGDGYSQRTSQGINNRMQKWIVTFDSKHQTVGEALYSFFDGLGGVSTFAWVPPGETLPRLFIAPEYSKDFPHGGRLIQSISTTFEEVVI